MRKGLVFKWEDDFLKATQIWLKAVKNVGPGGQAQAYFEQNNGGFYVFPTEHFAIFDKSLKLIAFLRVLKQYYLCGKLRDPSSLRLCEDTEVKKFASGKRVTPLPSICGQKLVNLG